MVGFTVGGVVAIALLAVATCVVAALVALAVVTAAPGRRAITAATPTHPPDLDPLSAGILLRLHRRAAGAGVIDLVTRGHVVAQRWWGPAPWVLRLVRPVQGGTDPAREALQLALFGPAAAPGTWTYVGHRDPGQRARVRTAAETARTALHTHGLLASPRASAWAIVLPFSLLALTVACFFVRPWAGGPAIVLCLAGWIVAARIGPTRSSLGQRYARALSGFRDVVEADARARSAWPAWSYLFVGSARHPSPYPPAAASWGGGGDGAWSAYTDDSLAALGASVDADGGASGDGDGGDSGDGGGDGGGGGD